MLSVRSAVQSVAPAVAGANVSTQTVANAAATPLVIVARMLRKLPLVLVLFAASLAAGCGESYDDGDLTLISGPITASAVDELDKGSSQGDTRAFTQELFDEGGDEPVGRLDGTTTITDVENRNGTNVEYRSGTIQFTLDDGNILASGNYLAEEDVAVPAEGVFRAITGGTGEYRGARGEVEITPEDDERVRYELDFETPSD